jgi:hypothetical protein
MSDLLIITNSYDATTDVLLGRLGHSSVFRLNFDQITKYTIRFDAGGFEIADPTGRTISSHTIRKGYWRKPFSAENDEEQIWTQFVDAEMHYLLAELVNLLWADQKLVLVEPFAERRTGKLLQLRHAQEFFSVPAYEFVLNNAPRMDSAVVKSLSNELVGEKVLFTTRIQTDDLDLRYPWFVERYVAGSHDVTVVFVRKDCYAFSLKRDFLNATIDWRECMSPDQKWIRHSLPESLNAAIVQYMEVLKLDFGRLDFLLDNQQRYWFCEVNPNGQFAWLDLNGEEGLLDAIVREISPCCEHYPLRNRHPLELSSVTELVNNSSRTDAR